MSSPGRVLELFLKDPFFFRKCHFDRSAAEWRNLLFSRREIRQESRFLHYTSHGKTVREASVEMTHR